MSDDDEQLQEIRRAYRDEQNEASMSSVAATLAQYRDALLRAEFTREEAMMLVHNYHAWMLDL